jgi:hypothetical protein
LEYRGALRMAAAARDEFAYYGKTPFSSAEMGYFSRQLFGVIDSAIERDSPEARWEKIVPEAVREIRIRTSTAVAPVALQHPIALNELEALATSPAGEAARQP